MQAAGRVCVRLCGGGGASADMSARAMRREGRSKRAGRAPCCNKDTMLHQRHHVAAKTPCGNMCAR